MITLKKTIRIEPLSDKDLSFSEVTWDGEMLNYSQENSYYELKYTNRGLLSLKLLDKIARVHNLINNETIFVESYGFNQQKEQIYKNFLKFEHSHCFIEKEYLENLEFLELKVFYLKEPQDSILIKLLKV
jgi:hypothetical protein